MRPAHLSPAPTEGTEGIRTQQRRLTLLAHGSPDPRHGQDVREVAERTASRLGSGWRVGVAFLDHQSPTLAGSIEASATAKTGIANDLVCPLLLTGGFHRRHDVPAALGQIAATGVPAPRLLSAPKVRDLIPGVLESLGLATGDRTSPSRVLLVPAPSDRVDLPTRFDPIVQAVGADRTRIVSTPTELAEQDPDSSTVVVPLLVAGGRLLDQIQRMASDRGALTAMPVGQTYAFADALARTISAQVLAGKEDTNARH